MCYFANTYIELYYCLNQISDLKNANQGVFVCAEQRTERQSQVVCHAQLVEQVEQLLSTASTLSPGKSSRRRRWRDIRNEHQVSGCSLHHSASSSRSQ